MKYAHLPHFNEFYGIDIRSSERTRARGFSGDGCLNVMHTAQGGIGARPGTKQIGSNRASLGLVRFAQKDILGEDVENIIGFGSVNTSGSAAPYKLVQSTFTLHNDHATLPATVSLRYDTATSQYRFQITRGGVLLIDHALGTAGSGSSLTTLDGLVSALPSFGMSGVSSGSAPAAYMQLMNEEVIAALGTLDVTYHYWEQVQFHSESASIVGTKHPAYELGLDSFQNVSAVMMRGVLYVAWGATKPGSINGNAQDQYAQTWKYDGQNYYAIGAPYSFGAAFLAAVASRQDAKGTFLRNAPLPAGAFSYRIRQVSVDKAGNRVEGDFSEPFSLTADGAQVARLQLDGGLSAPTAHAGKHGAACENGGGSGLVRTVDSGHSLETGDIAFFFDAGQERCIQREVTATTATTATLSITVIDNDPESDNYDNGSTPNLNDNAVITNNVRCEIYRTKLGGTEYYFIEEVPLRTTTTMGGAALQDEFYDEHDNDDLLVDALIEPGHPRSWRSSDANAAYIAVANSPAGRYLATFNDLLLISGNDQSSSTVYFSDIDGPEYFPKATHNFDIDETVTGMAQCGEVLLVWSKTKTYCVQGSLTDFNFRVSVIAEVGCESHHSIQQLEEGVVAWLSAKGPYVSFGGRRVEPLGPKRYKDGAMVSRIESFFTEKYSPTETQPAFKRAVSAHLPKDRLYLLFVPFEDPSTPSFATSASVIWAYDYGRGLWWKWNGMEGTAGMAVLDDVLYFNRRRHDGAAGSTIANLASLTLFQQQRALARTNSADTGLYNYADHATAITWRWKAHWETLGRPATFKRFLRNKISCEESRAASSTPMTVYAYFDWDESRVWSDTITWTTQKSIKLKLRAETCQSMMVAYEQTATFHAPPLITGYELEAVANFRPEMKE